MAESPRPIPQPANTPESAAAKIAADAAAKMTAWADELVADVAELRTEHDTLAGDVGRIDERVATLERAGVNQPVIADGPGSAVDFHSSPDKPKGTPEEREILRRIAAEEAAEEAGDDDGQEAAMTPFERAVKHVLQIEGGYVNDSADRGGETNHGITIATARAAGYRGDMKALTRERAIQLYRNLYWDKIEADALDDYYPPLAERAFDTAVNMGVGRAGEFLQRALNVLTDGELTVDGDIGPATLAALNAYKARRGDDGKLTLLAAVTSLQGAFYITLAERRSSQRRFIYGWLSARITKPVAALARRLLSEKNT